jgi:protease I
MAGALEGRRIAFLTANEGVEQVELTAPWDAVVAEGGEPVLLAPEVGDVQGFEHLDKGKTFTATVAVADANVGDYDALVLPGGVANPDQLRTDADAVGFVKAFAEGDGVIAAICHAPWTLVEAGVVDGRNVTSWPSLQTDLRNAGASWSDEALVVDGNLVTSRKPDDLPVFCGALVDMVAARASSSAI